MYEFDVYNVFINLVFLYIRSLLGPCALSRFRFSFLHAHHSNLRLTYNWKQFAFHLLYEFLVHWIFELYVLQELSLQPSSLFVVAPSYIPLVRKLHCQICF